MRTFKLAYPLVLLLLTSWYTANAAPLSVSVTKHAVTIGVGNQRLTASTVDGTLRLHTPYQNCRFHISILQGKGWTTPQACQIKPEVTRDNQGVQARLVYPVTNQRELVLELTARAGLPAVFVTSKLRRLKSTAAEYYYWASDFSFDRYQVPAGQGATTVPVDKTKWASLPAADWLYFPSSHERGGGLMVLPTNVSGRTPGETGTLFLHALPRSLVVGPGEALQAGFGLAGVPNAGAAQQLAQLALAQHLAVLEPWRHIPAPAEGYGPPAPAWLRQAEVYNLYYHPTEQWTEPVVQNQLRQFPFIVGSTPQKPALDRCHRAGIRLLHYVVYTCLLNTAMEIAGGGKVYSEWLESIGHEARDLKDHPDWVCIDSQGHIQKDAWGQAHHHPGLLDTCLHQPGLRRAALDQVRQLMGMGYDGVFVDLAGPTVECYGPRFHKHTHPDPGKTNTEAYDELLADIYRTVKSYGQDRVVIQNTCTSLIPAQWHYCDAQMLEAMPFGGNSAAVRDSWPELRWWGAMEQAAVAHGKVPVILPYLSKIPANQVRGAALFSYAYARVYGSLWADAFTLENRQDAASFARQLYAVRLGQPTGDVSETGGVVYRAFERGMAAFNPSAQPRSVSLPVGVGKFTDVGYNNTPAARQGHLTVKLAPWSGRVLVRQ